MITYLQSLEQKLHIYHTLPPFYRDAGSGKTSLLDVIACRNKSGEVTGDVMLNGVSRTAEMLSKCAAYVRQDDRLMASLTVRETLMFVAQLKLPKTFDAEETKARVSFVVVVVVVLLLFRLLLEFQGCPQTSSLLMLALMKLVDCSTQSSGAA